MDNAIIARREGGVQPPGQSGQGMSACAIAGIALGALVFAIVLSQVPDLIRYARMSSM